VTTTILCTDGSDVASDALRVGLSLLRPADRVVLAVVVDDHDESLVLGTSGFAGGQMSAEAFEELRAAAQAQGERIVAEGQRRLDLPGAETRVLHGEPGPSLCALAEELDADTIVMGSRGRGGIKRVLLGSVSDYVARHAPCTVVITRAERG
jgi:nucleotide-binding universal stress UspA family protein